MHPLQLTGDFGVKSVPKYLTNKSAYRMQAVAISFLDQWSSVRPGLYGSVLLRFRPGAVHSAQSSE
jgi:hypothetical protein